MKAFWVFAMPLLLWLLLSSSCGSRDLKLPVAPAYSSIQQVTIGPKCLRCHASLATYSGIAAIIKPGDPINSRIYKAVTEGGMPQQSPPLSDAEVQAIRAWIQAGAPNN